MDLLAQYIRIYAVGSTVETTPRSHPASPVRLLDFPSAGLKSEIHLGAVPDEIMEALKCNRAWAERMFRGGCKSADEVRQLSTNILEETILYANTRRRQPQWYATLCIDDQIQLPEDPGEELLGVLPCSFLVDLDNPTFFDRHTEAMDQLAVQIAMVVASYRYRWLIWDGPIVHLPTGIALRPPQPRGFPPRAFAAPSLEAINLMGSSVTLPTIFKDITMVLHFFLRAVTETDRISRFFDAFRGLEVLCGSLSPN